jgi:hypothetical protein
MTTLKQDIEACTRQVRRLEKMIKTLSAEIDGCECGSGVS